MAAQFVESVVYLNSDPLIEHALKVVRNKMHTGSVSEESEFDAAYKSIKSLAVKTYTACGDDADWPAQAAHFIATATKACLTPMDHLYNNSGIKNNLAWKCAMQTRMAKNCEMIESDSRTIDNEAQKQYAISNDFLNF
ncbi:MAG: hypothetical protein KZQ57_09900 [gamma proteobacterium symbiont of Lucinoma myriamae]|nr:hypothetical protein [gamma proteobacterium symbiont of Lucinoma myriamae]